MRSTDLAGLTAKYAGGGKVKKVMDEWKAGTLHSGSKNGPQVTDQKQAIAIALSEKRKREKLAAKYKTGGKVTNRRGATVNALKGQRARLKAKYATGGTVPFTGRPVAAPRDPNGFWARLQTEIKALNANSQMPQAPALASKASPDTAAQQVAMMAGPQAQPSAKVGG